MSEMLLALIAILVVFGSSALLMFRRGLLPSPTNIQTNSMHRAGAVADKSVSQWSLNKADSLVRPIIESSSKTYALVIGADAYLDPTLPRLAFVKDDAQKIRDVLERNYDLAGLTLLTGQQTSKMSVMKNMQEILQRATANDKVLVYFAGHGFYREESGQDVTYYGTYDTDRQHLENTALSSNEFREILSRKSVGTILMIFDGCLSDSGERMPASLPPEFTRTVSGDTIRAIITTRTLVHQGVGALDKQQLLFTKYLLEGLTKGVVDQSDFIRIRDLLVFINQKLDEVDPNLEVVFRSTSTENFPLLSKKTGS